MVHRQNKIDIKDVQRGIINDALSVDAEYASIPDKDAIFEQYCIYDGQYDDAHEITERIIGMLKNGIRHSVLNWKSKNIPGIEKLSISISTMPNQKANASSEIVGDTLVLEVSASIYDEISNIGISRWEEQMEAAITHELSHAKIETEQGPADENRFSEISEKIIYERPASNDYRYRFILMGYFCYYHEIQSYVSQIPSEINVILKDNEQAPISVVNLVSALKNTDVYKTYSWVKSILLPNVKSFDTEMIKSVANEYKKYNPDIAKDIEVNFNKYIHYFEQKIDFAFKKIRQVFNYVLKEHGLL